MLTSAITKFIIVEDVFHLTFTALLLVHSVVRIDVDWCRLGRLLQHKEEAHAKPCIDRHPAPTLITGTLVLLPFVPFRKKALEYKPCRYFDLIPIGLVRGIRLKAPRVCGQQ